MRWRPPGATGPTGPPGPTGPDHAPLAGLGGAPPSFGGPPYFGSGADDEQPTAAPARPLPHPEPAAAPPARRRWSTRARLGVLGLVLLAAAGLGVGLAVATGGSSVGTEYAADVTLGAHTTPAGAVTVTWSDAGALPGFQLYLVRQDGRILQSLSSASTSLVIDGVPAGTHCFRVDAVFTGRLPRGLPAPSPGKECVTVP